MLQLLSEVIQPALTEGRYFSFLSFAMEMENRDKVLAGMIDSKLTSRDSLKTGNLNNSTMTACGEIQLKQDQIRQTLQNSVGMFGIAEIARQAFYDTSIPEISMVNIL
jgi:hypothetical protein